METEWIEPEERIENEADVIVEERVRKQLENFLIWFEQIVACIFIALTENRIKHSWNDKRDNNNNGCD